MQKREMVMGALIIWINILGKRGARFLSVGEGNYKY